MKTRYSGYIKNNYGNSICNVYYDTDLKAFRIVLHTGLDTSIRDVEFVLNHNQAKGLIEILQDELDMIEKEKEKKG